MDAEIIRGIEKTIKQVGIDIRKKKGDVGSERLDAFAKVINAYRKLCQTQKEASHDLQQNGDPDYYNSLCK